MLAMSSMQRQKKTEDKQSPKDGQAGRLTGRQTD